MLDRLVNQASRGVSKLQAAHSLCPPVVAPPAAQPHRHPGPLGLTRRHACAPACVPLPLQASYALTLELSEADRNFDDKIDILEINGLQQVRALWVGPCVHLGVLRHCLVESRMLL